MFSLTCSASMIAVSSFVCLPALLQPQTPPRAAPTNRPDVFLVGPSQLFIVDDTASACSFSNGIQLAVNAASNGDVILVKRRTRHRSPYPSFVIEGKSLCVIAEPSPTTGPPVLPEVAGFEIRNLRADQAVIVRGLAGTPPKFTNNAGPIWVEDCHWTRPSTITAAQSTVGFFRTETREDGSSRDGAEGMFADSATIFAYHSTFQGKAGLSGWYDSSSCCGYCDELFWSSCC